MNGFDTRFLHYWSKTVIDRRRFSNGTRVARLNANILRETVRETQSREAADKKPGSGGTAAQRAEEAETTGDPGRTPGQAEGVDDPEQQGDE